ncbi:hypothetical protein AUEXF2481DRAFT_648373 [Aureobasidium subglaciale EXF-2481]|uniref:Uncharacterized protein n=1 Tax=Aureobasidium subglaciale (strain EXF-2481) TaxID=1043005 RepID=A0A074YKR4_AURSE|nr:uncharacterized protein AUEXF2481DRAFT_648373 [Aureobasidium subglaciale EXF-2481]KEQ96614.1 hypothetical protein AUEXF2481DRAFT_648373 [Aureobasidium subglaciale EXF-2481]
MACWIVISFIQHYSHIRGVFAQHRDAQLVERDSLRQCDAISGCHQDDPVCKYKSLLHVYMLLCPIRYVGYVLARKCQIHSGKIQSDHDVGGRDTTKQLCRVPDHSESGVMSPLKSRPNDVNKTRSNNLDQPYRHAIMQLSYATTGSSCREI